MALSEPALPGWIFPDPIRVKIRESRFLTSSRSCTLQRLTATQALGQNYSELASMCAGRPGRAPSTVFAQGRPGQRLGERLHLTVGPTRETASATIRSHQMDD